MTDQAAIAAMTQPNNRFETVTLSMPIVRGETAIDTLTLRKPKSGELRGLSLQDILGNEVTVMLRLIPRISEPPLTDDEVDQLEAEDLAEMAGTIRGFFMTKGEKEMMGRMIAAYQPKT